MTQNALIPFAQSEAFTLGVEMELQVIDKNDMNLKPVAQDILSDWPAEDEKLKPEIFQSMLEINTGICRDAKDAERDLRKTVRRLLPICDSHGVQLASNGTHPFANWVNRKYYPAERYDLLVERNQHIARRLMIYGLHVHIGMRDGEHCIQQMNEFIYYLPHILAISASSPFWGGNDTGLASSRITIFEAHPAGGHPCQLKGWQDFEDIVYKLMKSRSITSFKDIWWDFRPSPNFGTLEVRICDGLPSVSRTVRLVAFIHLLALHIERKLQNGTQRPPSPDWLTRENKWRASRFGLSAEVIIDDKGTTRPLFDELKSLRQDFAADIKKYGYETYMEELFEKDLAKPSYIQQREIFEKTEDLKEVVKSLCQEFREE
jgi:carboxylate-amine ligase